MIRQFVKGSSTKGSRLGWLRVPEMRRRDVADSMSGTGRKAVEAARTNEGQRRRGGEDPSFAGHVGAHAGRVFQTLKTRGRARVHATQQSAEELI